MEYAGEVRGRDRIAIATSIAIHLCAVAALLAMPTSASFPTDDPDERLLLASTIRIEHRPPVPRVLVRRTLVPQTETAKPFFRPVIRAAVAVEHAARRLVVAAEAPNAYAPPAAAALPQGPHNVSTSPVPANLPVADAASQATPIPTPTPVPAPTAVPATPAAIARSDEGIGNFGETYPASIDPALRGGLTSVGSGFVVRVAVDENGHATSVEFVRSPADATLREELRAKLLATRFIPAACNGLRCAGTLELKT